MQWSKAKTIIIIFFVTVDMVLLSYLAADNIQKRKSFSRVADSLLTLLEENGVNIDKKLITAAAGKNSIKSVYVENIVSDSEKFAKDVLGGAVIMDNENKYTSDIGSISFSGDNIYAVANDNKLLFKAEAHMENAEKIALEYMEKLGLETKGIMVSTAQNADGYSVRLARAVNGFDIFDSRLDIEMNYDGIISISGNAYNEIKRNALEDSELKNISGVLIEFMNRVRREGKEYNIKGLKLGYAVLETDYYHKGITLMPVWQVYYNDGMYEYIDAREN